MSGVADTFIEAKLRQTDGKSDIWHYDSEELWTPCDFPLRLSVALGAKNWLRVLSADTKLLEIGPYTGDRVNLWLPTDERLTIWAEEGRASPAAS